ncbi:hypothetical protein HK100_007821 [Physocladia obscura]|uniref:Uncharacterized protein n=1 Tax=Physocladia obscura TaxID=109957 RepID=A0AAD5SQ66_9FUNG|nr:hypothetical protein HK100_007821 [Physocladia obscura]
MIGTNSLHANPVLSHITVAHVATQSSEHSQQQSKVARKYQNNEYHPQRHTQNTHIISDNILPPLLFGLAAVLIGSTYPILDTLVSSTPTLPSFHRTHQTFRLIGAALGLRYASDKLAWTDAFQATAAHAVISIGTWLLFDASIVGIVGGSGFVAVVFTVLRCGGDGGFGSGGLFLASLCWGNVGRLLFFWQ